MIDFHSFCFNCYLIFKYENCVDLFCIKLLFLCYTAYYILHSLGFVEQMLYIIKRHTKQC